MSTESEWPALPGTYILLFVVATPLDLEVGCLGRVILPAGRYAYVGSARGSGGLRARLQRHLGQGKRVHWHVDYLAAAVPALVVHYSVREERLECRWTRHLLRVPGTSVPMPGFGSGDCRARCAAHLIRLADDFRLEQLEEMLLDA